MIEKIIEHFIRNKCFVVLVTGVVIALGVYSMLNIPLKQVGCYS
jgi:Cu/Ag efflux pump CusA